MTIIRTIVSFISVVLIALFGNIETVAQLYSGEIKIDFSLNQCALPQEFSVTAYYTELFDEPLTTRSLALSQNGYEFYGKIPMSVASSIIAIKIGTTDRTFAMGYLELQKDSTITMSMGADTMGIWTKSIYPETPINLLWLTSYIGNNQYNVTSIISNALTHSIYNACALNWDGLHIKAEDFDNWEIISAYEDSIFMNEYNDVISKLPGVPCELSDLFKNNLEMGLASRHRISYKHDAKEWFDKEVGDYPTEYYSFLQDLNFSDDMFFRTIPIGFTPYYFTCAMLNRFPVIALNKTEVVSDWRKRVKSYLSDLGLHADENFYDFLLATTLIKQIRNNLPLEVAQKIQMRSELPNYLFDIIINENNELVRDLSHNSYAIDYTEYDDFNIEEYIKKNYSNTPVVVDLWNTWCGPCISAHRTIRELKDKNHELFDNVIFIYLSDDTSNFDLWKKMVYRIGGMHIRLNSKAMKELMAEKNLGVIPAYLFYNKDNELTIIESTFPKEEDFLKSIDAIK